jgi:putative iron-regulated protein
MKSSKVLTAAVLACFISLSANAKTKPAKKEISFPEEVAAIVVADYSKHIFNTYTELLKSNKALLATLEAFTKAPSLETQNAAKAAWLSARAVYSPTEAFRFYGGPIDDAETGPEGLMNAWPLDEAYVDYVKEDANAGIINNTKLYPKITKDVLISLNEKDGEKNISTGYHAIEFLLWGQDFDLKSAGKRSFEDYIKEKNPNAERRATYLKLLAQILVEHTETLVKAWDPSVKGNYVERFLKEPKKDVIQKISLGLGTLSMDEMSGERLTVPLEKNDQENEQNCFSDTTEKDMLANQNGIMNIYTGNYNGFKGAGLGSFISAVDAKGDKKIQEQMNKTHKLIESLKTFDNIIVEKKNGAGRKKANQTIDALQLQAKLLAKSIHLVGMDINIEH